MVKQKLLVFSAFDEKATSRTLQQYLKWYQANEISSSATKLGALAHTLAARRSHMRWRSFAVATPSSSTQLVPAKPARVVSDPSMAWVFTGQGAQHVEMGLELASAYPVFEDTLKKVEEVYRKLGCSWSIFGKRKHFPGPQALGDMGLIKDAEELRQADNINKPEYSQPLSTAIQLGLVELLRSFGLVPKAVVGHSSGEIAAAYVPR